MPALQRAAVDVGGDFAPVLDAIEERLDHALAAPDGEEGPKEALYTFAA
jgi:hypothetical protein